MTHTAPGLDADALAALEQIAAIDWGDTAWWAKVAASIAEGRQWTAARAAKAKAEPERRRKANPTLDLKGRP